MLENQIYSIESANINQETLNAMKSAGKAMKDIHGNLTIDKVDNIMCVQAKHFQDFCIGLIYPINNAPHDLTLTGLPTIQGRPLGSESARG